MDKKMENEMKTGIVGFIGCILGVIHIGGYIGMMEKKMETIILYRKGF